MKPAIFIPRPAQINAAIRRENVTATALAKRCKISRSTLYRYINEPGSMPVSVWVVMVNALNLDK